MTELLKRWAELEPGRCSTGALAAWVTLSRTEHPVALTAATLASERAIILAAVIEATTARGWVCRLESDVPSAGKWYATVWTGSGPRPTRLSYDGMANEPTKAYLRAYLAALEVEAAQ